MAPTVAELLRLYTIRQGMARDGVTHPNAVGRALIDTLVRRLSEQPPSATCDIRRQPGPGGDWPSFVVDAKVLAKLWIPDGEGEIVFGGPAPAAPEG